MMKTALASAAILGAVMVAPAQADNFTITSAFEANLTLWKSAWESTFVGGFLIQSVPVNFNQNFSAIYYLAGPPVNTQVFSYFSGTPFTQAFANFNLPTGMSPVPGPIAGAGLPLLAAGLAFVAWRRRRAANAA